MEKIIKRLELLEKYVNDILTKTDKIIKTLTNKIDKNEKDFKKQISFLEKKIFVLEKKLKHSENDLNHKINNLNNNIRKK